MKLNASFAINNLSFGFASFLILDELRKREIYPNLFPIGGNADVSTFDKMAPEVPAYLQACAAKAQGEFSRDYPHLKLWHINQSEQSPSNKNYLFVFHELDSLTQTELNILNNQTKIFVSSNYTKKVFEDSGVKVPVVFIPLGFDSNHFRVTNKKYYSTDVVVWSIFGKLEHRKRHDKTIKLWLSKFGNNPKHRLHIHTYNTFLSQEQNNSALSAIFEGKSYSNVVALPYTKTLSELNECYNATNIVLDMSGAEGWSLPSFHCVGLGKHAVVHNATAMSDWANKNNAVLVESSAKIPAYDGVFFHPGQPFNQGNIFDWNSQDFLAACDEALIRYQQNPINIAGLNIQKDFTWSKTVDKILEQIPKNNFSEKQCLNQLDNWLNQGAIIQATDKNKSHFFEDNDVIIQYLDINLSK
jgi:hypothetical protein